MKELVEIIVNQQIWALGISDTFICKFVTCIECLFILNEMIHLNT